MIDDELVAIAEEDIEPVPTLGTSVDAGFLSGVARSRERLVPVIELSRAWFTRLGASKVERLATRRWTNRYERC